MQLLPNKYAGLPWFSVPGITEGGNEGEEAHEEEALPAAESEEEDYETINGYAPSDLRGSYTLEQTAGLLNLSLDELYSRLGLPADYPSSASLKDAAAQMGMDLRDFKHQLFD